LLPLRAQDTTVLALARMLAANSTLRELGLSKHALVGFRVLRVLVKP
jgi:hypothetical protein